MRRIDHLFEQLGSYGTRSCMEAVGFSCTYEELLEHVGRWGRRFDELDVAAGEVVGLKAEYGLPAVAALLALMARRAVAALIPRDRDVAFYSGEACASAVLDLSHESEPGWQRIADPKAHALLDRLRAQGDGGVVIFTSGSTGRPKAALQGTERFLYKFRRPARSFRTLAFLLFDHVAGLDTLFYTLAAGGTLVLARDRHPRTILSLIESHRVEVLPTSPSFLRLLCAAPEIERHDLSSLRVITYGSEVMDPGTLARLNAAFPNVQISQKYGATEIGAPRSVSRGNDSLWIRIKNDDVETKIVDEILWVRGEGTILGYLNAPSPVDEEGWYCTGDLVDTDDGWIRFRGRASDTIKVGGEKVSPAEVEQAILELAFVDAAAVRGEPHPIMGQVVTARVSLLGDGPVANDAIKQIRAHCRRRLAPHKVPVRIDVAKQPLASERQKVLRR